MDSKKLIFTLLGVVVGIVLIGWIFGGGSGDEATALNTSDGLAYSDYQGDGTGIALALIMLAPGMFVFAWMVDIWWRTVKNEKNTRKMVDLNTKMLIEMRNLRSTDFGKDQYEPEKPKRPAVELPPKSKASKPTIYEL